jgi:hypothetical protein
MGWSWISRTVLQFVQLFLIVNLVDIVDFLCCGKTFQEGHPTIHGIESEDPQENTTTKRVHWFDNYMILPVGESVASCVGEVFTMESELDCMVTSSTAIAESDHHLFHQLWKRRRDLNGFSQQQQRQLMGNLITPWLSNSTNGTQEGGARDGHGAPDASRQPRSSNSNNDVALLQLVAGKDQANKYGKWHNCTVCGLRMLYIPFKGAPCNSTSTINPGNMNKALKELKEMMPKGQKPNEELVKVILEKVIAEERLRVLLDNYKTDLKKNQEKIAKAKAKSTPTSTMPSSEGYVAEEPQSSNQSPSSWTELHQEPAAQADINPMDYLTENEQRRVMELVAERMASQATASRVPVPDDVELEPAYGEPSLA